MIILPILLFIFTFISIPEAVLTQSVDIPINSDGLPNPDYSEAEVYADLVSIQDEFEIDDEALVIAHIQSDIEDFEDLRHTIKFLENHISKHADVHVVRDKELREVDSVLKELDHDVIKFYENELVSLKSQISKLNHKFDNDTIFQIGTIVETAESFLQMSMSKIDEIGMIDQEWEVQEETAKIQKLIDQDEISENGGSRLLDAMIPDEVPISKSEIADKYFKSSSVSYPIKSVESVKTKYEKSEENKSSIGNLRKVYREFKKVSKGSNMAKDNNNQVSSMLNNVEDYVSSSTRAMKVSRLEAVSEKSAEAVLEKFDPVEHYSSEVREALKNAKDESRKFVDKTLHHDQKQKGVFVVSTMHILLTLLAVLVLCVTLVACRGLCKRRTMTIQFQNMSGYGGHVKSLNDTELVSIKEDDGWGRSWSPWVSDRKKSKFK